MANTRATICGNAEAPIGRALVEMSAVRLPERLAVCDPPQQGQGRVGEIIERQHKRRGEMAVAGQQEQQPGEQQPDRQAADVAEKYPRHRPVERRKADQCRRTSASATTTAVRRQRAEQPDQRRPTVTGTTSATVIQSMPSMKFVRLTNHRHASSSSARSIHQGSIGTTRSSAGRLAIIDGDGERLQQQPRRDLDGADVIDRRRRWR